ncbi:MAG TPA: ABC transporter permease, partial [Vicinamibacterales bacterium]|nr:ABC transporter permease [Vicinamibacterales bacterium]
AIAYRRYHAYRLLRRQPRGSAWQADLKQTWRQLWQSPGYAFVVVIGLSLGISATLAVVSTINAIRWGDPAGVVNRSELRRLIATAPRDVSASRVPETITGFSMNAVRRLEAALTPAFTSLAAEELRPVNVRANGELLSTLGAFVSGDYFPTLGTHPVVGRLLNRADDRTEGTAVVISYALWQESFGSRIDIVGTPIDVSGFAMAIAGVAPPAFNGRFLPPAPGHDTGPSVWMPLATTSQFVTNRNDVPSLTVVVRLSEPDAENNGAALDALRPAIAVDGGAASRSLTPMLQPVGGPVVRQDAFEFVATSALLLAGPLAVLIIACANVANMRLARGTSRTRELSVRAALGADTRQLIRLLAMEAAILTVMVLGVSWLATRAALVGLSSWLAFQIELDVRVAIAAALLGAATLLLSGIVPAWLVVRRSGVQGLRQTAQAGGRGHTRLRNALVVVQVAGSLVLLAVTVLAARSLQAVAASQPPIFSELVLANLNFASEGLTSAEAEVFTAGLTGRLAANPIVSSVGASASSLFSAEATRYAPIDEADSVEGSAGLTRVTADWFRTMGLHAKAGRLLKAGDGAGLVVVDETVAASVAPGASAVGRMLRIRRSATERGTDGDRVQIVGVVSSLPADPGRTRRSGSILRLLDPGGHRFVALYIRTRQPEAAVRLVRDLVASQASRGPWTTVETAESKLQQTTNPIRSVALSAGALAVVALLLSAIGLGGVTAYVVSLRRREIGVRLALGGRAADVVFMIVRQSLRLVSLGAVIGLALAVPATLLLRDELIGVSPLAVGTFAPPILVLAAISLVAAGLPALAAARVNPVDVLRDE